jgi:phosphatidyl-myo-inositol dimannoside synthase
MDVFIHPTGAALIGSSSWLRRSAGARIPLVLRKDNLFRAHGRRARFSYQDPKARSKSAVRKSVKLFLTNSDYTWQRFLSFNPGLVNAPHLTVPLGVGSPATTSAKKPHNPPVVLMISRLLKSEDYKGHREMINAWPLVLERIPKAELWIAGDGDLRDDLEKVARAGGLAARIRFFGQVSEEEKQNLLAWCRCLAMPSRGEGFGLVYLEAMRLGRPCLVSTMDAGREVVNPPEAGLAANPDDPEELAGAICRLISDGPEWDRWSAQARRRYEQYFTAGHFQERLLSALGAPSPPTGSRNSESGAKVAQVAGGAIMQLERKANRDTAIDG